MGTWPRVGIPVDVKRIGDAAFHAVGEKYLAAVAHVTGALPLLLPALGRGEEGADLGGQFKPDDLLDGLDGLFLTGSHSNIEPRHWGESGDEPAADPQRDATTLPLVRSAIGRDLPVLAVCRGLQELNVALGGSLHRAVHTREGYDDHREDGARPRAERYGPAHPVTLTVDGLLQRITGAAELTVNSLHGQGVQRLGRGLVVEARAPDGLVEAVHLPGARFVVGVQWHPEWDAPTNPASRALFEAFGDAVRAYAADRKQLPQRMPEA
ncbi:gamma-glutamyl-gamma-aminobutyrate hydrolase family protein [Spiribacter halobius]|uniref:gamma-glutamyl-gamma-aminobutyrate hydrolase n=1 Tax=Sediminicurvatus halobius TaxID=2182432 RepID=A0A2U2N206_9GAMM|nr:gamma-glutamyl-gamma-aminobutyrate hydrolase family protein [Spiribacter halobius]PWG63093.1 hypothetical protein DEM34_09585 [Spiribacter halobius]UEX77543.1 gamma-glutamyl-gamma-aminobutyrate hydrolase family protein [Spiribacter halobius]